jgi:hypothetical protein
MAHDIIFTMMLAFWITVVVWAVASFFLHIFLHELGHWLVGGGTMKPWPHKREDGTWLFGSTTFDVPISADKMPLMLSAPAIVELIWWTGSAIGLGLTLMASLMILPALLCVEAVSSLVDLFVWMSGWFTKRARNDSAKFQAATGWSWTKCRLIGSLWLILFVLTGMLVFRHIPGVVD